MTTPILRRAACWLLSLFFLTAACLGEKLLAKSCTSNAAHLKLTDSLILSPTSTHGRIHAEFLLSSDPVLFLMPGQSTVARRILRPMKVRAYMHL